MNLIEYLLIVCPRMQLETNFNVKFAISMQNLSAILKSGVKGQISDGPIANIFIQDMFLPYTKFHACIIKRAILAYFCTRQPNYKSSIMFMPQYLLCLIIL